MYSDRKKIKSKCKCIWDPWRSNHPEIDAGVVEGKNEMFIQQTSLNGRCKHNLDIILIKKQVILGYKGSQREIAGRKWRGSCRLCVSGENNLLQDEEEKVCLSVSEEEGLSKSRPILDRRSPHSITSYQPHITHLIYLPLLLSAPGPPPFFSFSLLLSLHLLTCLSSHHFTSIITFLFTKSQTLFLSDITHFAWWICLCCLCKLLMCRARTWKIDKRSRESCLLIYYLRLYLVFYL